MTLCQCLHYFWETTSPADDSLQKLKSIEGYLFPKKKKQKNFVKQQSEHFCIWFAYTAILYKYTQPCCKMYIICPTIRMCELEYTGSFVTVLDLMTMKDVILVLNTFTLSLSKYI